MSLVLLLMVLTDIGNNKGWTKSLHLKCKKEMAAAKPQDEEVCTVVVYYNNEV